MAENILQELRNGNSEIILPLLSKYNEDEKKHFAENEIKYKIKNWRIGDREDSADTIYITYWISRENYFTEDNGDILEDVTFFLSRESNEFKLTNFSAIY